MHLADSSKKHCRHHSGTDSDCMNSGGPGAKHMLTAADIDIRTARPQVLQSTSVSYLSLPSQGQVRSPKRIPCNERDIEKQSKILGKLRKHRNAWEKHGKNTSKNIGKSASVGPQIHEVGSMA